MVIFCFLNLIINHLFLFTKIIYTVLFFSWYFTFFNKAKTESIFRLKFEEAKKLAQQENKLIFIDLGLIYGAGMNK